MTFQKDIHEKRIVQGSPLDGLFSDIPDLVEEVCAEAYKARATRRLRMSILDNARRRG
jgi:hypothetical protein